MHISYILLQCFYWKMRHFLAKKYNCTFIEQTKYPFVKFNFICAIKYGKHNGYKLYKKDKCWIDVIKLNEFYNEYIKRKYQNNLIVMQNFINQKKTVVNITSSKNKILNIIPYNTSMKMGQ